MVEFILTLIAMCNTTNITCNIHSDPSQDLYIVAMCDNRLGDNFSYAPKGIIEEDGTKLIIVHRSCKVS